MPGPSAALHCSQAQPPNRILKGTPKCWCLQLSKARTTKLVGLDGDQRHGNSSVFLDSPSGLEPCATNWEPHPDLGCQLYLHLPQQQQEEVEQLLVVPGKPNKG
ncbi:death domain-containing membrane protein NRADD-like [Sciurus carolinensis]|uniref:death domain-containing membrane protein NRADD-like n=1 Tax=Sciurus carolinensis TaxID=30640 RepID=UPI001FB3F04C|nr:death domain-containing membrane protein NRADD-like [Sciurus carolinensis]